TRPHDVELQMNRALGSVDELEVARPRPSVVAFVAQRIPLEPPRSGRLREPPAAGLTVGSLRVPHVGRIAHGLRPWLELFAPWLGSSLQASRSSGNPGALEEWLARPICALESASDEHLHRHTAGPQATHRGHHEHAIELAAERTRVLLLR